ncbi:MAG: hypothetical protein K2O32_15245 [Acetatifactor sp.]|nr:hypothetical protein [Acetatifactor sp.]
MVWLKKRGRLLAFALPFLVALGIMLCNFGVRAAEPPVITKGTYHFAITAWEGNSPTTGMYLRYYDYDYTTPYPVFAYKRSDGNNFAVYFYMVNDKGGWSWLYASNSEVVINRAIYRVYQNHDKNNIISDCNYINEYVSGRGLISGVTGIFSDADVYVSCPFFESESALKNYLATGDTSGMISEGEKQDVRDTAVDSVLGFYGFQCDSALSFSWDGLASFVGGKPLVEEVDPEDFVDVFFGVASLNTGEHLEEKSLFDLGPYSQPMVSDNRFVMFRNNTVGEGKYIEYVRFTPYHYAVDPLGKSRLLKCVDSMAYFDRDGNFVSYDGAVGYLPVVAPPEIFEEDFFLGEFDTGIDFVDLLLNAGVRFVNAILKSIYNIREILFGSNNRTGLFQLVERIAYYSNPLNLAKFLNDSFWKGFHTVFNDTFWNGFRTVFNDFFWKGFEVVMIPDADMISGRMKELMEEFQWAELVFGFADKLFNLFTSSAGAAPPSIRVDFSNTEGAFSYGSAVVTIDFAWYARYKPYVDTIVASMIWVGFLWRIYKRLPEIIHGGAMVTDMVTDMTASKIDGPGKDVTGKGE